MEIKPLVEIKRIIQQNPKASGVGFAIALQLFKLADDFGLVGYDEAARRWQKAHSWGGVVKPIEELEGEIVALQYEGLPIVKIGNLLVVGIKETIQQIDRIIAGRKITKFPVKGKAKVKTCLPKHR